MAAGQDRSGGRAPEKFVVARIDEVPDGARLLVEVGGREIGVFNVDGEYYALLNRCPHLGGPLCEGLLVGLVESDGPGDVRLDSSRTMLTCPWHMWEFDIRTGQSYLDPKRMMARNYRTEVCKGRDVEDAQTPEVDAGPGGTAHGPVEGPFVASTIPISVEDDYLVVLMRPGRGPVTRPARGSWRPANAVDHAKSS